MVLHILSETRPTDGRQPYVSLCIYNLLYIYLILTVKKLWRCTMNIITDILSYILLLVEGVKQAIDFGTSGVLFLRFSCWEWEWNIIHWCLTGDDHCHVILFHGYIQSDNDVMEMWVMLRQPNDTMPFQCQLAWFCFVPLLLLLAMAKTTHTIGSFIHSVDGVKLYVVVFIKSIHLAVKQSTHTGRTVFFWETDCFSRSS